MQILGYTIGAWQSSQIIYGGYLRTAEMSVGQRVLQPGGRSDASHIVTPIKTISVTTTRAKTLSLKIPNLYLLFTFSPSSTSRRWMPFENGLRPSRMKRQRSISHVARAAHHNRASSISGIACPL